MDKWKVLGISSDSDEEMIQNAYYDKLEVTNPEEDEKGFMELRKAYEEAIREVKNRDNQNSDDESDDDTNAWLYDQSPEGEWMIKIRKLYESFKARIEVANWNSLLEDPVCVNLDTKNNICERLLVFFMSNYYLPHRVFETIDQHLNLLENRKEWMEKFPENYIDYIENEIRYDDEFGYDLFDPLTVENYEVYDQYISKYYEMVNLRKSGKLSEAREIRETLSSAPIWHPFTELDEMLILLEEIEYKFHVDNNVNTESKIKTESDKNTGNHENTEQTAEEQKSSEEEQTAEEQQAELKNRLESLMTQFQDTFQNYQEVPLIQYTNAKALLYCDQFDEAEEKFDLVRSKVVQHTGAMRGLAECKMKKGQLLDAKELLYDVLQINNYDAMAHLLLEECNKRIREKEKEEPLEVCNAPEDNDSLLELAWANSQSNDYTNALTILNRWDMPENSEYELEKTYLTGFCHMHMDENESAQKKFEYYVQLYSQLRPSLKDKKLKDATRRYYLSRYYLAEIAIDHGEYETAMSHNEIAEQGKDENYNIYQMQEAEILLRMGKAEEALRICESMSCSNDAMYYILYARVEKETGQYQNALAHINKAISLFPYIIKAYILQMQIYTMFEQYDQVEQILDDCDKLNMPQTQETKIMRSLVLDSRNEYQKAVILCEDVLKDWMENPKTFKTLGKEGVGYIHDMAEVSGRAKRFDLEEQILSFSLDEYPENESLLYHKAYFLHNREFEKGMPKRVVKKKECENEALELLRKVVSLNDSHRSAYGIMGEILEDELEEIKYKEIKEKEQYIKRRDEVITVYHKQCRNNDIAYYRISAGLLLQEAGRLGEAEEDFAIARKIDEENPYASYNLGTNMLMLGKTKEAEEHFLQAMQKLEVTNKKVPYIFYKGLICAYCRQERHDEAVKLCDDMISKDIFVLSAMYQKADILRITGHRKECMEVCKKALKIKDNDLKSNFYDIWAQCYVSNEKDTKKSIWFRKYISYKKKIEDADYCNDIAIDYMYRGDTNNAERYFSKAIFMDDDSLMTLSYTAYVCAQNGNLKRVKKLSDKIEKEIDLQLELYRDRSCVLRYACMLHIARSYLPEYDKEKELEEALRLASLYKVTPQCLNCKYTECFELIYLQGIIAHKRNDLKKAEEYLLRAVSIGSNEGECHRELRNIRKEMKRKKQ